MLGRRKKKTTSDTPTTTNVIVRGPDLDFKIGKIIFTRAIPVAGGGDGVEMEFEAFKGTGNTIKQKRKK